MNEDEIIHDMARSLNPSLPAYGASEKIRKIEIPEPRTLKSLPHFKGLPVPVTATVKNGIPNFADINWKLMYQLGRLRKCALCGQNMSAKKYVVFIGGPRSAESRLFADGPAHPSCAFYATQVCPYLSTDKEYRPDSVAAMLINDPMQSPKKPDIISMFFTWTYEMGMGFNKRIMYLIPEEHEVLAIEGDIQELYRKVQSMGEVVRA